MSFKCRCRDSNDRLTRPAVELSFEILSQRVEIKCVFMLACISQFTFFHESCVATPPKKCRVFSNSVDPAVAIRPNTSENSAADMR